MIENISIDQELVNITSDLRITTNNEFSSISIQIGEEFKDSCYTEVIGRDYNHLLELVDFVSICKTIYSSIDRKSQFKNVFRRHFSDYNWFIYTRSSLDDQNNLIIEMDLMCDCEIDESVDFDYRINQNEWVSDLLDRSIEAIIILNARDARIVYANQKALHLVNQSFDEIKNQHVDSLFANKSIQEDFQGKSSDLFKKGSAVFQNVELNNHASTFRNATVRADIVKIGKYKYIYSVISEHRMAKHLDQQDEFSHFKALFDDSLMGSILVDLEGNIFDINDAFTQLTGFTKAKIDDVDIMDLAYFVFDKRTADDLIDSFKRSGKISNEEVLLQTLEKEWRWARLSSSVIHDSKGQALFFIVTIENIHDVKQTEIKYQANQELLMSLSANLNEGIYRSSLDNGIIFANDAFVQKFGYDSFDEIENSNPSIFYADEKQRLEIVQEILDKGRITGKEIYFKRKDGSRFWGLMNSSLYYDDEGKKYLDGVITDISNQKKNEKLLKKNNKDLKKINKEMDKFVYSISHDLRAPLMSLLGLLKLSRDENRQESLIDYFSLMEQSVMKLDEFIKDIIDYSRNTRTDVESEVVNFEDLITETWNNLQFMEEGDKINFSFNQNIPDNMEFRSDPRRLTVILSNLLSNAVRYHNLDKEDPRIDVEVGTKADQLIISVKDNGPGIPKEFQEKIFEMFFRANQNKTGSGLGLYIVKDTVEKLGGEIDLKSNPVLGSNFIIQLPL